MLNEHPDNFNRCNIKKNLQYFWLYTRLEDMFENQRPWRCFRAYNLHSAFELWLCVESTVKILNLNLVYGYATLLPFTFVKGTFSFTVFRTINKMQPNVSNLARV